MSAPNPILHVPDPVSRAAFIKTLVGLGCKAAFTLRPCVYATVNEEAPFVSTASRENAETLVLFGGSHGRYTWVNSQRHFLAYFTQHRGGK